VTGPRIGTALRVGVVGALLLALAACGSTSTGTTVTSGPGPGLGAAVARLPQRSVSPMPTAHLAANLIPPTNRWFSGLVFGDSPQPVFPLPLSFGLTGSGFAFGTPAVHATANTILGEYAPTISVNAGAASSEIIAYDAASVTIELKGRNGTGIGAVVIAEGSPVVTYTALRGGTLSLGVPFAGTGRVRTASTGGASYGLVTPGKVSGSRLVLRAHQTAEWFVAPRGVEPTRLGTRVSALKSVSVGYSVGHRTVSTTLSYHSSGQTMVAATPQQAARLTEPGSCSLGTYSSVYGVLSLCAGSVLSWTSPKTTPSDSLDSTRLTSADRATLAAQLRKDIRSTKPLPTDSYFGGKALYRLANLLTVAHDVDDTSAAAALQSKLDAALERWTTPNGCESRSSQCFVYDPVVKGVVGLHASFGSDQFNDHDFHYGYFLYAASVAAKYRPSLTGRLESVMNLLAADIGTIGRSTAFPTRRLFDAYAGHSWASGYAPFADGNNQESSSEAVDAWNGLALWGDTTHNAALAREATWMLSAEAASAKADWTDFGRSDPAYSGYEHSVVGINWGGKRDYATWFSADASAKLGIQLIPMSPASTYLAGDGKRIAENLAEAAPDGYDIVFGDYLLMYSALEGPSQASAALVAARTLPQKDIDDADSRTYLLAWLMTR
jgi:endo-1,3(4)-beta-glucanase